MSEKTKVGRFKRVAAYLVLAATSVVLAVMTILDFREFFGENRGIEFYRERPYLIGLCIVIAVAIGYCTKFIIDRRNP